jgi:hypothetical protein
MFLWKEVSSSGDNILLAGISGKKIRITSFSIQADAPVNVYFKSGSTKISSIKYIPSAGSGFGRSDNDVGHIETNRGENLILNLSTAVNVSIDFTYEEIS